MLGSEGEGFTIVMKGLDGGRIGIAAQSLGVAQAAFDAAVKYAKQREPVRPENLQVPGPALDHRRYGHRNRGRPPADPDVGAAMKDRGERYTIQASMAKLFASEMVNRVTAKALQMHGGYGFTKDYPVERYYRDARVFTIYEGTSEIQRVVIMAIRQRAMQATARPSCCRRPSVSLRT
jgi:butyryl-CoA dehydrogenase